MLELAPAHCNRAGLDHPTTSMYTETENSKSKSKVETAIVCNIREADKTKPTDHNGLITTGSIETE
jgi:hypothetical protein